MLNKFNYFDVLPIRTPYDPSIHLKKSKVSSVSQTEYAKIIGRVMFFISYIEPDIAYVVSRLSLMLITLIKNIDMHYFDLLST